MRLFCFYELGKIVRNNQGSVGKFSRDLGFLHEIGKFSVLGERTVNRRSSLLNDSILHRTKERLFSFSMIPFSNRNDEKWPHTREIKIFGRNHILPPLGIEYTLIMQSQSI